MVHAIPGRRAVEEALRAGRTLHEVALDARAVSGPVAGAARAAGVQVRVVEAAELDRLAHGVRHQGVVALAPAFGYAPLPEVQDADLVVVLDGVTDPQNLGGIARSAELAGAGGLVLPQRRSAHVTAAAEKAAAGAFSHLPVVLVPNLVRALGELAEQGFWSVGLDADAQETIWSSALLDGKVVVVIGAEGRGLGRLVAERVDALVSIPMRGRLGALNASAAAAVVLFEIVRRRSLSEASRGDR